MGKGAQGPGVNFIQVEPAGNTESQIDFVFLPEGWKVVKAKSTPIYFLDHCFLTVQAEIRGGGAAQEGQRSLETKYQPPGK